MMCGKNFAFWYGAFLFFIFSSSISQQNFAKEKNDNSTMQYEVDANSTASYGDEVKTQRYEMYDSVPINDTQHNNTPNESRTSFTSNDNENNDSTQSKFGMHYLNNRVDDKQISMEPSTDLTNVNDKKNFTSQEISGSSTSIEGKNNSKSNKLSKNTSNNTSIGNVVSYKMCRNIICIQFCCSFGNRLVDGTCIPEENKYKHFLPKNIFEHTNDSSENKHKKTDESISFTVYDPCQENVRLLLPLGHQYDYKIFANGSLYLSYYKKIVELYCLAIVEGDTFEVTFCNETSTEIISPMSSTYSSKFKDVKVIYTSFHVVSILFLISTFLIYSILPELRNIHGFMLRNYSGSLFVAYMFDIVNIIIKSKDVPYPACITIGFLNYFSFLTSFFWLNIMSFDMWWTFRGFGSLQRNVRKRQNKRLTYYAIYAWGLPFIFAIFCIIMETFSNDVPKILQPEFIKGNCFFNSKEAFAFYYYGLKSICIISSVCLSISTALKIARYDNDTNLRLTNAESQQYNDNKKWFNLYLKLFMVLFIVMGIKWSMITVIWSLENVTNYTSYIINIVDIVQNFCTFIIFVWKKKIKLMLLKRYDFGSVRIRLGFGLFPENQSSTNTASNASTHVNTAPEEISMQKRTSSCEQKNCRATDSSDGTKF